MISDAGLLDAALALLVVAVAVWTVSVRDSFAAVVGFTSGGLLLALVWLRLAAVDVALTEAAIGSGVTGALLIGAHARLRPAEAAVDAERPGRALRITAATLSAAIGIAITFGVLLLPDEAPSLAAEAAASLPSTGLGNPVTAVLVAYRALDTLLEAVVLLLALLGVWSLAPDALWNGRPGVAPIPEPDGPLTFMAQILVPLGILIGVHLVWVGADAPGGAFQGGTVLAAMWMLTMMAGLTDAPAGGSRRLRLALAVGPALFLAIGLAGFALPAGFLSYPDGFAKPAILAIEAALTLSIAATLALLAAGPARRPA